MAQRFKVKLNKFYQGFAPYAHLDPLTEEGAPGQASEMTNIDILSEFLRQGPGLAALTLGTNSGGGILDTPMNFLMDTPIYDSGDETLYSYGISDTKLHRVSADALIDDANYPHTITECIRGNTVVELNGQGYYFFKAEALSVQDGRIGKFNFDGTFDDNWQNGLVPTAVMPVATKEDVMLFGHGPYVGSYFGQLDSFTLQKLFFGANREVIDIIFHANQWLIAVNGSSLGRAYSQIYAYDGSALTAILADEVSVGLQKIGWLIAKDGLVFVAYQDLSFPSGFNLGYLAGRKIEPLAHLNMTDNGIID
jgi:hypothetical protein